MKQYAKHDYDLANIRRLLEPGPVVLISCTREPMRRCSYGKWFKPKTYCRDGQFMISGREIDSRQRYPDQTR